MKSAVRILIFSLLASLNFSCRPQSEPDPYLDKYREFVNEHHDHPEKYFSMKWSELNWQHNELQQKAEINMDYWSDSRKAEYENTQLIWEIFRDKYLVETNLREDHARNSKLLNSFLPTGILEDMSNVTKSNILKVYQHFVSRTIELNYSLTSDQWKLVELCWERLERRKDQLDQTINREVKLAIVQQKSNYMALRPKPQASAKHGGNDLEISK